MFLKNDEWLRASALTGIEMISAIIKIFLSFVLINSYMNSVKAHNTTPPAAAAPAITNSHFFLLNLPYG